MPNIQRIFPMVALAALMVALTQAPANAKSAEECKLKCRREYPPLDTYLICVKKKGCSEEKGKDEGCKHACAREHPSPQYDNCKKKCLAETNSSKKGKHSKK